MKKILLIRTIEEKNNILYLRMVVPPLGLLYIASSIRNRFPQQYDIKIIDMRLFRLSVRKMESIIKDFNPDIIGCSVLSSEHKCMNGIADLSKKINRNIKFIVGGPHPIMYSEEVLINNNIDIAVIGEGEETICDLLNNFKNGVEIDGIAGIAFKRNSRVIKTNKRAPINDLDIIPFPAWDLIKLSRYSDLDITPMEAMLFGKRYMAIFTSRGCPYQCAYCHNIFGKVYRKRSAENVFKEILELYNKYAVDEFHIFDDIFNFERKRVEDICDLIISSGIKIWISFPNALRGDILDVKLLEKLKLAGTYSVTFALETISPRIQAIIKRNANIDKINLMIEAADNLKLLTRGFFMVGFPSENIEEIKQTISFACNSKLCWATFFIVRPQKSTELFEIVQKEYPEFEVTFNEYNYMLTNRSYEQKVVKLPLEKIIKYAHIEFYLNPFRFIKIWFRTKRKVFLLIRFCNLMSLLRRL